MKESTYIFIPSIDVAARIKNSELKDAINKFNKFNEENDTDELVEKILKAQLIIPAMPKIEWLSEVSQTGTCNFEIEHLVFPMLERNDGKNDMVTFTDVEEFFLWNDSDIFPFFVVTDFHGITKVAMKPNVNGVAINPFSPGVSLPKSEIKKLKQKQDYNYCTEQKNASVILTSDHVQIWNPRVSVTKTSANLLASLISFCLADKGIELLYYFKAKINGEKAHLIIVDYTGDVDATFDGLKKSAKRHIKSNERFCILPFGCILAENITRGIEPLYKKA